MHDRKREAGRHRKQRRGELGQARLQEDRVGIPGRQKESLREWRGWCPGVQALALESCLHHHFVSLITVLSAMVI